MSRQNRRMSSMLEHYSGAFNTFKKWYEKCKFADKIHRLTNFEENRMVSIELFT